MLLNLLKHFELKDHSRYCPHTAPKRLRFSAKKRDENYILIKNIVDHEQFYIPSIRSSIINEIINNKKSTKQTIYRLLRQYWQRTNTKCIDPNYQNSGAKGGKRLQQQN